MSLLGIDVGTTGCKAAAFCEKGICLHTAYREYPTHHDGPGRAELDSREIWTKVKEVIAEVARETWSDPVTALCVSTMGEAVTPVNADGEILDNCILSTDLRGEEYLEPLKTGYSPEALYRINPNILAVSYTMPKIRWIQDHQPEIYEKTKRFLYWGGLVEHLLGCDPFTSHSHANRSLLFDIEKEDWSDELLDRCGVDREKLPPCLPGGAVAGTVSEAMADELGLSHGVKVVVGAHDQCLNALGAGAIHPGSAVDGIGTFECITPVYEGIPQAADRMLAQGLNIEHHVLPGLYVSFLYNQAGSLVRWFRDTFAQEARNEDDIYDRLTSELPTDPTKLMVLPYFEMTGSPAFVGNASGVIAGLKIDTKRGDILKAIMENVTYYFRQSLLASGEVGIHVDEFVATGGGAKSDAWLQIKADIMGAPYVRLRNTECGLAGAAMRAGLSTGVYASPEEAVKVFVHRGRTFEPDAGRHAQYRERFDLYKQLFPHLYETLQRLDALEA
ncbi:MAG: FGGY-family carbohydrate kinase [Planctomycetota bacterium]|jgi:xylulokinase